MSTQQLVDDLSDIVVVDIEPGHDTDGLPKTLPKKPDGTPDDRHHEKPNAAEEARKAAEAALGKAFQDERAALIAQRDAERAERERIQQQARQRLEAEQKRREQAEAERDERATWAKNSHWAVLQERKTNFEQGFQTMSAHVESLQAQLETASEAGDHKRIAYLNTQLAESTQAKANFAQAGKRIEEEIADVAARFRAADEKALQEKQTPPDNRDDRREEKRFDLDDWIAQSPAITQPWLKAHRAELANEKYLARVYAFAQSYALDKDDPNAVDSAEFVDALKAKFDKKDAPMVTEKAKEKEPDKEEEEVAEPEERASHAAPVSRGRPAQPSSSAGKIELTRDEFNAAPNMYSTYEELGPECKAKFPQWSETAARWQYHHDKQRAKAAGKYDR